MNSTQNTPTDDALTRIKRTYMPIRLRGDEFLWFLRLFKLTFTAFGEQVGRTRQTVSAEAGREYVRETWAELIRATLGVKTFTKMRKKCREELDITDPQKLKNTSKTP